MSDWISNKSPGFYGAMLGMLAGVGLFGFGLWSFFMPESPPLPQSIAMLLVGFVEWVACFYTMKRLRVAWAFAVSVNGTGGLLFLFGAPKVSGALGVHLALGFLPPVGFIAITMLLLFAAEDFG